jgi:hypothetical protein
MSAAEAGVSAVAISNAAMLLATELILMVHFSRVWSRRSVLVRPRT